MFTILIFWPVPLSTVDQGASEIGKRAADLLVERIASKRRLQPRKVLIEPKLVIRQSTQRATADLEMHTSASALKSVNSDARKSKKPATPELKVKA